MKAGSAEPLVKGSVIREFALWYEGRHGTAYVDAFLGLLPPNHHDLVWTGRPALGIVSTTWYPSEVVHALLDAVSQGRTDEAMRSLIRNANEVTVAKLSRGLYQLLFKMVASPALYAKHVQKAWRTLHSTGMRKVVLSQGLADSTIDAWSGHHRWLCLVTMETMRAVFGAMGCTNVVLERTECVHDGHPRCRALLHYGEPP